MHRTRLKHLSAWKHNPCRLNNCYLPKYSS